MGRLIAAVIAGYGSIGVLVVITDRLFAALVPGFKSMTLPPDYYFAVSLATDTLYSLVGGYLCCLIARQRCSQAVLALIVLGEGIGIATQATLWKTVPHWFGLALLILYPPAVFIGSRIRLNKSFRQQSAAA